MSKELTQAVTGKRIAWLMAILAAVMLLATVAQTAQTAHAATYTASNATISLSRNTATGSGTATTLTPSTLLAVTDLAGAGTTSLTSSAFWPMATATVTITGTTTLTFAAGCVTACPAVLTLGNTIATWTLVGFNATTPTLTYSLSVTPTTALAPTATTIVYGGTALAPLGGIASTITAGSANYMSGAPNSGATVTAAYVGPSLITNVEAAGTVTVLTSATFTTTNGVFPANGTNTISCVDQVAACDLAPGGVGVVAVQFSLAAPGTATITITPLGVGTSSSITVTLNAAQVLSSQTLGTVSGAIPSSNTNIVPATFTFALFDQNSAAFTGTATTTVSTNLGVIDAIAGTCETNGTPPRAALPAAFCTTTATTGTIEVYGNGIAGTATVTITSTSGTAVVSGTRTVTLTGAADTITAKTQSSFSGVFVDAATANFGTGFRVISTAKDVNGTPIVGYTPTTVTVSPTTCAVVGTSLASTSVLGSVTPLTAGTASAGTVCTVTVTSGTKTATSTFTIGGTSASTNVVTVTAVDVNTASTQTVTVTIKDSAGNFIGDNTSVTLVPSAGAVAGTNPATTLGGVATFTYVSPGTAQTVVLTAVTALASGTKTINVGSVVPAGPVQQVITATSTGVFCFVYSGPTTAVANFGTFFTSSVVGVNILQLPAGNYQSWFRAAPTLATATSLTSSQTVCVAGTVGSNVFN